MAEIKELTRAEEQIMQLLWKQGKAFVKDIIDEIPEPKPAYNTVSTIIRILEKKGFVGHNAYGKTYEYFPLVSKKVYTLESGISISLLALIYVLFLRGETFFRLNRLFLVGSLIFSVFLPFLRFRIYAPKPVMLAEVTVTPYRNLMEAVTIYGQDFSVNIEHAISSAHLLILIYLAGAIFFLSIFLYRIFQVSFLIRKNRVKSMDGYKLVILEKDFSPFSFMNYVFVSSSLPQDNAYRRMIAHELEHVRQGHSFDVIILEMLTVFQWFNPFMWMLRRAVRENHEYLADQAVLTSGENPAYYKYLLLNQFVGGQLDIDNNFNYSLIKNRIKMMTKIKSSKLANSKILFGFLVAAALIVAFACEQKESVKTDSQQDNVINIKSTILGDGKIKIEGTAEDLEKYRKIFAEKIDFDIVTDSLGNTFLVEKVETLPPTYAPGEEVFFIVEDMPEFPGGEQALRKYIAGAVKYPEIAQKNGIQGKVYVTFVVAKDGSVTNAKIARGVDPALDQEALRVVNSLPKWKPGKQRGKEVNVSYTVPINFVLQ
jgi:TonB family protein